MKKALLLFVVISVILAAFPVLSVQAENEKVEISFCVGDDTLMINSSPVKVEKPYVVGAGVTLVPIRVITEAFGAKVGWDGETRAVSVELSDISITLWIDDPVAEVNGKQEKLLSAPELTPNGYTMIPLRFISETFGATVSYEDGTGKITVVKEIASSDPTVQGIVDNAYIGDSFFGWSMENPKDMYMSERIFDGTYTAFASEMNEIDSIIIDITPISENYDLERDFASAKASFKNFTLVKAEKDDSNDNVKSIHIQARDKSIFADTYSFATDTYRFFVQGIFDNTQTESRDKLIKTLSSFKISFDRTDIYDLSTVKDGFRKFTSDVLKLSFNVPQDFVMLSDEDSENSFMFCHLTSNGSDSSIIMEVYSKDAVGKAFELAQYDYEHNTREMNEDAVTINEDVREATYGKLHVFEYCYTENLYGGSEYIKDIFFEIGDYVYNISVRKNLPADDPDEFVKTIIESIEASEIDASVVGTLMRNNYYEADGTFVSKSIKDCTITLPNSYSEEKSSSGSVIYVKASGISIAPTSAANSSQYSLIGARDEAIAFQQYISKEKGVTIITTATDIKLGFGRAVKMVMSQDFEEEKYRIYEEVYFIASNSNLYCFLVLYPELTYSEYNRAEVEEILTSITFN